MFLLASAHCNVIEHHIKKNLKVCCTTLSIPFHVIYYFILFLDIFFPMSALTLGPNNVGQGQMLIQPK